MQQPTTPSTLMPSNVAVSVYTERVYQPAFFDRLAQHGIVPKTAQDRATLLEMAYNARQLWEAENNKQAGASPSNLQKAASELRILTQKAGLPTLPSPEQQRIEKAAREMANDSDLVQAIISMYQADATTQAANAA